MNTQPRDTHRFKRAEPGPEEHKKKFLCKMGMTKIRTGRNCGGCLHKYRPDDTDERKDLAAGTKTSHGAYLGRLFRPVSRPVCGFGVSGSASLCVA
jgi:hypothetical protein